MSSIIGAIFFFVIAMSLIGFSYEVSQKQILMQSHDSMKVTEEVDAELQILPGGHLLLRVKNRGAIPARLTRLWIIDKTDNDHIHYPNNLAQTLDIDVAPWEETEIRTDESEQEPLYSEWVPFDEEHEYSIRLVTELGNIIEPLPFRALSGETVASSSYPPWVSIGDLAVSSQSSPFGETETPVPTLSKDSDGVTPYDGGKAHLSVKNSGDIAFFLTFNSRVVFKATTGSPQKCYASRLNKWWKYTWDGSSWDKVDDGGIDQEKDSKAVYPEEIIVVEFEKPREAPGQGNDIPSGTYRVYLHLSGYDATGNAYFQDVYYGIITF